MHYNINRKLVLLIKDYLQWTKNKLKNKKTLRRENNSNPENKIKSS